MTQDGTDTITLNRAEQYILKDTITKFIFGLKGPDLRLGMDRVKSRTKRAVFTERLKKAEAHIDALISKSQMCKTEEMFDGR